MDLKSEKDNLASAEVGGISISPGDIILFSRSCTAMDAFSGLICVCAKIGSMTAWDHVGIAVPMSDGTLGLLEINFGGVTLRSLSERLRRTKSSKFSVRKLLRPRHISESSLCPELSKISAQLMDKKYNNSILSLALTMFMSHFSEAQLNHQVLYNIDSFDRMINDLNVEFNSHLTPSTAILYRASRSYLDEAMKIRNLSAAALGNNLASRSSNIGADSNLSASYICSHLVADILFKLGALYPSAIIETKYFVPADLSSSSIVPGISLWFRSGETKSQLYSISPDIEFQKADLVSIVDESGTVRVQRKLPINSEKSINKPMMDLTFSPGDKFPLGLFNFPYSNLQIEVTRGDVELFTPIQSAVKSCNNFIKVLHLSEETNNIQNKICESFILMDNPGIDSKVPISPHFNYKCWNISDNLPSILQFSTHTSQISKLNGWHYDKIIGWVWVSSGSCYLRAGSHGARVIIRKRSVNNNMLNVSIKNSKHQAIVREIVRLLTAASEPSYLVESYILSHSYLKAFRAGEIIGVDKFETFKARPEQPLKFLLKGSVRAANCIEDKKSIYSDSNQKMGDVHDYSRSFMVPSVPLLPGCISSSQFSQFQNPPFEVSDNSLCLLSAEDLLYSNGNENNVSWIAETDCELLFVDRTACSAASLAYGKTIGDVIKFMKSCESAHDTEDDLDFNLLNDRWGKGRSNFQRISIPNQSIGSITGNKKQSKLTTFVLYNYRPGNDRNIKDNNDVLKNRETRAQSQDSIYLNKSVLFLRVALNRIFL